MRNSRLVPMLALAAVDSLAGAARPDVPVHGSFPLQQLQPTIALNGAKAVAVMFVDTTGAGTQRIRYSVSADSGKTFTDKGQVPSPAPNYRWFVDAQVGVDRTTGDFWMAGVVTRSSAPKRWGIAVMRGTWTGASFAWSPATLVRDEPTNLFAFYFSEFCLEVDRDTGHLHLFYGFYLDAAGDEAPMRLLYQRSTNAGATWSAPAELASASTGEIVEWTKLALGAGGTVIAAWNRGDGSAQSLRSRSSADDGLTWGAELTAASLDGFASGAYSLAINRVAASPTFGMAALAWTEPWPFASLPFPPMTGTPIRTEIEPNGSFAAATAFAVGEALVGAYSSADTMLSDADYWKVTLAAGQQVVFWVDSTSAGTAQIRIVAPSTVDTVLAVSIKAAYRAPLAGTYYLLHFIPGPTHPSITPAPSYRIRTLADASVPGEALDHRDIAVATLAAGAGAWSAPYHPSVSPPGFFDTMPTLWFANDGRDYLAWHDFSLTTYGTSSWYRVASGVLDPLGPAPSVVTVSSAPTHWSQPGGSQTGLWNDADVEGPLSLLVWSDARNGNSDVFAARTTQTVLVTLATRCPGDEVALPGETIRLSASASNPTPISELAGQVRVSGARGWPNGTFTGYTATVGGTFELALDVAVPDTAAPGVNAIALEILHANGSTLRLCPVALTIAGCDTLAAVHDDPAPFLSRFLELADINHDGLVDAVSTVFDLAYYALSVRLADGHGHFGVPHTSSIANAPIGLATGDFNADGFPDFAVGIGRPIEIRLAEVSGGLWTGGFVSSLTPQSTFGTGTMIAADFVEDGIVDLLCASGALFRGNGAGGVGDGTFAAPTYPAHDYSVRDMALGDFDENGILDVAFVTSGSPNIVGIRLGQGAGGIGDGTFAPPATIALPSFAIGIATGDFNEDGITDLAVSMSTAGIGVLIGNGAAGAGNGTFGAPVLYGGAVTFELAVADVTNDGISDIVAVDVSTGDLLVFAGTGSGTTGDGGFALASKRTMPTVTTLVTIADVRVDGVADVLLSGGEAQTKSLLLARGLCPSLLPDGIVVDDPAPAPMESPAPVVLDGLPPMWTVGEERSFTWSQGEAVQAVDVEFSRDEGTTWQTIARGETDGEFQWSVTGPATTVATFRVHDSTIPSRKDQADATFSIRAPSVGVDASLQMRTAFSSAWPNPARGGTRFDLTMSEPGRATIEAFDIAGKRIATLADAWFPQGSHTLRWEGRADRGGPLPPGIYFVRARAPGLNVVRRVVRISED